MLNNLLEAKLKLYDEFLVCTQHLYLHLEEDNLAEIKRLVNEREIIIESINKLDVKIALLGRKSSTEDDGQRTDKIYAHIKSKMKEMVHHDKICRLSAGNRCAHLQNEIQKLDRRKRDFSKYLNKPPRLTSKFLNIHS